jgi:hypothetical protein
MERIQRVLAFQIPFSYTFSGFEAASFLEIPFNNESVSLS